MIQQYLNCLALLAPLCTVIHFFHQTTSQLSKFEKSQCFNNNNNFENMLSSWCYSIHLKLGLVDPSTTTIKQ